MVDNNNIYYYIMVIPYAVYRILLWIIVECGIHAMKQIIKHSIYIHTSYITLPASFFVIELK
jgi:hypothetical protein